MRSLLALSMLVFSLNAAKPALAEDTPAAPQPGVDEAGFCTGDFLLAYMSVATEMNVLATYLNAREPLPNLAEAHGACTRLLTQFPNTSCTAPNRLDFKVIETANFAAKCEAVEKVYNGSGLGNQPARDLDSSPLNHLDLMKMQMTVHDKARFATLLNHARLAFAINGLVYDLTQILDVTDGTRCAIDAEGVPNTFPDAGQVFNGMGFFEDYVSGVRVTRIGLDAEFGLVCMNENGRPVTFGDLKKAFGSIAGFSMIVP